MANDQDFRVELEVDAKDLERARQTIIATTADTYEFADVYDLVEKEMKKAAPAVQATEQEIKKLATQTEVAAAGSKKLAASAQDVVKGSANIGRAALEMSRGLEDLQYGIGGVVNNIPSLVMALGGSAGLTAAISLLAVGANQLVKNWGKIAEAFGDAPFTPTIDLLDSLKDRLKENNKELDDLKKNTHLSAEELETFNRLTAENIELEKQKTAEMEKQKLIKKLSDFTSKSEGKEEKERAKQLGEAFSEHTDELVAGVEASLGHGKLDALIKERQNIAANMDKLAKEQAKGEVFGPNGETIESILSRGDVMLRQLSAQINEQIVKQHQEAQHIVARALVGGDAEAALQMEQMATQNPAAFPAGAGNTLADVHQGFLATQTAEKARKKAADKAKKAKDKADKDAYDQQVADEKENQRHYEDYLKGNADAQKAAVKRQIEQENKSVEGGGYVQSASALMAQIQAMGGMEDQFGRFHAMDKNQIFDFVANRVLNEMKRRNPGRVVNSDVATMVTARAQKNITQQMTAMNASGLTNQQKLIAIGTQQQQQFEQMVAEQRRQGLLINQLANRVRSRSRSHQNSGVGAGAGVQ